MSASIRVNQGPVCSISGQNTIKVTNGMAPHCLETSLRTVRRIAFAALLCGCATVAQQQAQQSRAGIQSANAELRACLGAINSNPSFAPIIRHAWFGPAQASLIQLTDQSKASQSEIRLLSEIHSEGITCRSRQLQQLANVAPLMVPVFIDEYSEFDHALVDLAQQKITWGEHAARRKAAVEETQVKLAAVGRQIDAALQASNQQKLAQRQVAINAMGSYFQQQQVLNALNRPVITNCNRFGNMVNCVSQ